MSTSLPSWARVGAKVVCVDDTNWMSFDVHMVLRTPDYWGFSTPVSGAIYTIRCVEMRRGGITVLLNEIDNKGVTKNPIEIGFSIHRFRPLSTIEDDIALHFAQHLIAVQPRKIGADA